MASFIDESQCIKCGLCASVCAASAVKAEKSVRYIDPIRCINCGKCSSGCPVGAISRGILLSLYYYVN